MSVKIPDEVSMKFGDAKVVSVVACRDHRCALLSDGRIECWGRNQWSRFDVPPDLGTVKSVAAGQLHTVALQVDGRVRCWGDNRSRQCEVPAGIGPVKAIAAGGFHTLALTEDGRVVCWGDNKYGKCDVPADLGKVTEIAAAFSFSVALRDDGRIVCWGSDLDDECQVPTAVQGRAVGICAGLFEAWAIDGDGRLHIWGGGGDGTRIVLPDEFASRISDDAWIDFAVREYPRCHEAVFPERIRALPQFETIRAMHRLAGG
jgi:alpha-tubulin suppressor-like RCC1 family protein